MEPSPESQDDLRLGPLGGLVRVGSCKLLPLSHRHLFSYGRRRNGRRPCSGSKRRSARPGSASAALRSMRRGSCSLVDGLRRPGAPSVPARRPAGNRRDELKNHAYKDEVASEKARIGVMRNDLDRLRKLKEPYANRASGSVFRHP